jgi:hypothetical protein
MADAVVAVVEARPDANDAHGKLVQDRPVPDELVGPHRHKRRDRVHVGPHARLGEPGRHPHHVLLRHANVVETVGEALSEGLQNIEAEIAGQQHDALVSRRDVQQFLEEGVPHGEVWIAFASRRAASSRTAWLC